MTAPPYTILLVDDDEDVREAIAAFLEARHYRVLMARTRDDALRLLSQEHVEVLTDVVMPGLNGIELAKQAKQLLPDLKVLFMTGYYSRTRRLGSGQAPVQPFPRAGDDRRVDRSAGRCSVAQAARKP